MRTSSSDAWYWNSDDTTKTTCDNLSELAYDYDLEKLAMKRAAEIALSYAHTRPNGERCFSIYDEEGVSYSFVGSIILIVGERWIRHTFLVVSTVCKLLFRSGR